METLPLRDAPPVLDDEPATHRRTGNRVLTAALVLVTVQVGIRSWLFADRSYYADDFDLLHLAHESPLLSSSYLLQDYVGHLMPGVFLLVGLVERTAPLDWDAALATLIAMQVLASLALLRLLRVLLGDRPVLLVPLAFGLFSPMTLGFNAWWAAAVNSMPLQIGLAWFLADAVLLSRTGRRRHAVSGTAALAFTLAFYIKGVLVPAVAFGVVALVLFRDGERAPVRAALRRGWLLWAGSAGVLAVWALTYLATRESRPVSDGDADQVLLTVRSGFEALVPTVLGGPFDWGTFPPGTPMASLSGPLMLAGALVLVAAFGWTVLRRRGALAVWALVLATIGAGILMAALGRSGAGLGAVAPVAYRYFAIESVVLPVAVALLVSLPARRWVRSTGRGTAAVVPLTAVATTAFVAAALFSTVRYDRSFDDYRGGEYLTTARVSLERAGPAPLLDQPLPSDVLLDWSYPGNLASRVFAPLPDRPEFAATTTDLRMLDDVGVLRPADVVPGLVLTAGPAPGCGWPVAGDVGTAVALPGPLPGGEWTARLDYSAERDGEVLVAFGPGEAVPVPVTAGSHTVFVRLLGEGPTLSVTAKTPDTGVCVVGGVVGTATIR